MVQNTIWPELHHNTSNEAQSEPSTLSLPIPYVYFTLTVSPLQPLPCLLLQPLFRSPHLQNHSGHLSAPAGTCYVIRPGIIVDTYGHMLLLLNCIQGFT